MITVKKKVCFKRSERGRRRMTNKPAVAQVIPLGRVPRVSRVMALAMKFEGLLRDGTIANTIELARLAMVTQPRITQVMNLLHLASDIQEALLFLPLVTKGHDPVNEKLLRTVCAHINWHRQRLLWSQIKGRACLTARIS